MQTGSNTRLKRVGKVNRSRRNKPRTIGPLIPKPPSFVPTLSLTHKFRFLNRAMGPAPVSSTITRGNLLDLYAVNITATSAFRIIAGIKLLNVKIWAPSQTTPTSSVTTTVIQSTTCALEWVTSLYNPSRQVSDSSMSIEPAYLSATPPPMSGAALWSNSQSSVQAEDLFILLTPPSSIIDVVCQLELVDAEAPTSTFTAPLSGVPGQVGGFPLDGFLTGNLVPVGLIQL